MPMNPKTERLLEILGTEVRDFVRAEIVKARAEVRAEVANEYGRRIAGLEQALGIERK
jgi:hypothetical protein